jgi:MYXO-CTERM domain-containing protein
VALIVEGATITLYLDGELEVSAQRVPESELAGMLVGRHKNGESAWDGDIDDLRLYDYALSAADVDALYAGCVEGTVGCSGACVDVTSDDAHCGACGVACGAEERCVGGVCEIACGTSSVQCSGQCVDITSDDAHCGACGSQCLAGQVCSNGVCRTECAPGLEDVDGVCTSRRVAASGGCTCATGQGSGAGWWLLLAFAAVAWRRTSRARTAQASARRPR